MGSDKDCGFSVLFPLLSSSSTSWSTSSLSSFFRCHPHRLLDTEDCWVRHQKFLAYIIVDTFTLVTALTSLSQNCSTFLLDSWLSVKLHSGVRLLFFLLEDRAPFFRTTPGPQVHFPTLPTVLTSPLLSEEYSRDSLNGKPPFTGDGRPRTPLPIKTGGLVVRAKRRYP